jgi:hypothetical protein
MVLVTDTSGVRRVVERSRTTNHNMVSFMRSEDCMIMLGNILVASLMVIVVLKAVSFFV